MGSDPNRHCICPSLFFYRPWSLLSLRSLSRVAVDSWSLLRHECGRNWGNHQSRLQAGQNNFRKKDWSLAYFYHADDHNSADEQGQLTSIFAGWSARCYFLCLPKRFQTVRRYSPRSFFFFKAAIVVYGSGMAIIPFIYGDVVERFHWLTNQQFLDAVSVGMITPG